MCVCVCVYIYIYIYTHTHIHTHIYKVFGVEIRPFQNTYQSLIFCQTHHHLDSVVTYFDLKISPISGQILQKDMHRQALPEDAAIL